MTKISEEAQARAEKAADLEAVAEHRLGMARVRAGCGRWTESRAYLAEADKALTALERMDREAARPPAIPCVMQQAIGGAARGLTTEGET